MAKLLQITAVEADNWVEEKGASDAGKEDKVFPNF